MLLFLELTKPLVSRTFFGSQNYNPTNQCIDIHMFDLPPTQDASHHQDCYISSRGSQPKPSFATGILRGGSSNTYHIALSRDTHTLPNEKHVATPLPQKKSTENTSSSSPPWVFSFPEKKLKLQIFPYPYHPCMVIFTYMNG